jgi:hypothetical protein
VDVTREYGYREIPDGLTPGKGGESSLLFDRDGNLAGHALFHPVEVDDEPSSTDMDDERGPAATALVLLAAGAAGVALVLGVRNALRIVRDRRREAAPDDVVVGEAGDAELDVPLRGSGGTDADPQDVLIEDVLALCGETNATMREYQDRRPGTAGEQDAPDDDGSRLRRTPQG